MTLEKPATADLMTIDQDDLRWARAEVDEARAAAGRGEIVSADEAVSDIDAYIASLKR